MARTIKHSVDRYRTFKGATYIGWLAHASDDRVAAYRAAGVRCRRLEYDLLVHEDDTKLAATIDRDTDK